MLRKQLEQVGAVHDGDSVFHNTELQVLFKNAWADHADAISLQYSGLYVYALSLFTYHIYSPCRIWGIENRLYSNWYAHIRGHAS